MTDERISVGRLGEICRKGDINFRFTSGSSAQAGIKGHRVVQRRRGAGYLAECPLSMTVEVNGRAIEVHGRADGIDISDQFVCLEEIKTVRVESEQIPNDVMQRFWFQACLYGHMLACQEGLSGLLLRICLYHLDDGTERLFDRWFDASELACIFADALGFYAHLLDRRDAWLAYRDESLAQATFPFKAFRNGQRDMSVAVYRAVSENRHLVIQAPTGIGKTMGTLYPAVQALASDGPARIFYLSARNSTQMLAEQAVSDLRQAGNEIRAVTITAKDKICFSKGEPCDPARCRYADGYYDRSGIVIDGLLATNTGGLFNRQLIETVAEEHEVCPFELSLDLSRWCDLIIGDYNYVFDPAVFLRRYFDDDAGDSVVLIDEAHNLVDRARAMYSAELSKSDYLALARDTKTVKPTIHRSSQSVNRQVLALRRQNIDQFDRLGYLVWREAPEASLVKSLQRFCEAAEEVLRQDDSFPGKDKLLDLYFNTLRFIRAAEWMDDGFALLLQRRGKEIVLRVNCVDPSRQLNERLSATSAAVCFSATLQPQRYFKQMLGLQEDARWYRIASPFPSDNLNVCVASYIDTSFRGRDRSLAALVQLIHTMISARQGNYLVFFPSYDYLKKVLLAFEQCYPRDAIIVQGRNMDDTDRQRFLAAFEEGPVCGFGVMGSLFSEGVDLKGDRLIGVMVVGIGLPQIGIERDLIRDHFEDHGFDYAYRFPGLVRVLQTAGRVIRDSDDQGVVCLVDRRFSEDDTCRHLPSEWQVSHCSSQDEVARSMGDFWASVSEARVSEARVSEADVAGETLQVDLG